MALLGLYSAFSTWMFLDAMQRRVELYWYPILALPPGPLVYFFMLKIHDPEFRPLVRFFRELTQPKVTLEELRFRAAESPSFANKLALARGLYDAGVVDEAATCFEAVLRSDEESKEALYGYAMCHMDREAFDRAIPALERLIEIKPSYEEYAAWPLLAFAWSKSERRDDALTLLRDLVRQSDRLDHRVLYASYLFNDGRQEEARDQLQQGMRAHKHASRFQRRQEASALKKARAMLSQLEAG